MEPISLILGALAAGALQGLGESASSAVKDAYSVLKELITQRFGRNGRATLALTAYAEDPEIWELPLKQALQEEGADSDQLIVAAAQELLGLIDPDGQTAGKYVVSVRDSQGVQVGDHNRQTNTFDSH